MPATHSAELSSLIQLVANPLPVSTAPSTSNHRRHDHSTAAASFSAQPQIISAIFFFFLLFKNDFLILGLMVLLCLNSCVPKKVCVCKCVYHTHICVCIHINACVHTMLGVIFGSLNCLHYHLLLDTQGLLSRPKVGFCRCCCCLGFLSLLCICNSSKSQRVLKCWFLDSKDFSRSMIYGSQSLTL